MLDDDGKRWGTLTEVAEAYGVSVDTIRRRMKRGELEARRQQTPQGFKWLAVLPEPETTETATIASGSPRTNETAAQGVTVVEHDREELVATLRQELALRNREISRLHDVIASQAHAIAQATAALPPTTTLASEQPRPGPDASTLSTRSDAIDLDSHGEHRESAWERFRRWFTGQGVKPE